MADGDVDESSSTVDLASPVRPSYEIGDPLDDASMLELQRFVEDQIGLDPGEPNPIPFVDDIAGELPTGLFVQEDVWNVFRTLGLVDLDDDRIAADRVRLERIRGTPEGIIPQESDALTRLVVVHEYAHVYYPFPQYVGTGELVDSAQVVSEGNAHRLAWGWAQSLTPDQQAELPEFPGIFEPEPDPRLPSAVQQLLEFPYDEGRVFTEQVHAQGGEAAIAELIENPPASTEQVLFFQAWLDDEDPVAVSPPADAASGKLRVGVCSAPTSLCW